MPLCAFDFSHSEVKLTVAPSCLIESWMKFWMHFHCHLQVVSAVVICTGQPGSFCGDAGQPPACGNVVDFHLFLCALWVKI